MKTAIITGICTLVGTIITVWGGQRKLRDDITSQLDKHNAVQDERIIALSNKVDANNAVQESRVKQLTDTMETNIMAQLDRHSAVHDERIKILTDKVEKHNKVIERTYKLEGKVEALENINK